MKGIPMIRVRRGLHMGVMVLAPVFALAFQQPPSSGKWTLLTAPVTVEATLLESEPATAEFMASFVFVLAVSDSKATWNIQTNLIAVEDLPDALKLLRASVAWRAPYLFVREECGGGNAWGCFKETVFEVASGRARRIGAFIVGEKPREAPQSLRDRHFLDWYDKLEDAKLGLCHARSPGFEIALSLKGKRTLVDRDATWSSNQPEYKKRLALIGTWLAQDSVADEEAMAAIIFNAVLAKYCGMQAQLDDLVGRVTPRLTADQRGDLQEALRLTVPLEKPSAWREND